MFKKSMALYDEARIRFPGGVHSPVRAFKNIGIRPVFIAEAEQSKLVDVDGNRFVDFCMAWGPLIFGHRDQEIADALTEALAKGWCYGAAEPYSLAFANFLLEKISWLEQIRFVNSGTEATMTAIRLARAFTGRDKIIKFDGCYHGHSDSLLVKAGSGVAELSLPDSAGVPKNLVAETLVAPLDDLDAVRALYHKFPGAIAAVIIEPLPANCGLMAQRHEFLEDLAKLAHEQGSLIIFDEVISGFRCGFEGVAGRMKEKPDLVTYGKLIGGGLPVGAIAGKKIIMEQLAPEGPVYQAGTLSANPLAMAGGFASLKKLWRESPYEKLASLTKTFADELNGTKFPDIELKVHHQGSIFWLAFLGKENVRSPADIHPAQKEIYAKLYRFLLAHGFYLPPSGLEVCFLSTAHREEDLRDLAGLIKQFFSNASVSG